MSAFGLTSIPSAFACPQFWDLVGRNLWVSCSDRKGRPHAQDDPCSKVAILAKDPIDFSGSEQSSRSPWCNVLSSPDFVPPAAY